MEEVYHFCIPGEPARVFKSDNQSRHTMDTYIERKLICKVTLENQYPEKPITTPIKAIFKFFLPITAKYRQHRVSIVKLFEFANYTARGIIYKEDYYLYDVSISKEYSTDPHTEIIIITNFNPKGGINDKQKTK